MAYTIPVTFQLKSMRRAGPLQVQLTEQEEQEERGGRQENRCWQFAKCGALMAMGSGILVSKFVGL